MVNDETCERELPPELQRLLAPLADLPEEELKKHVEDISRGTGVSVVTLRNDIARAAAAIKREASERAAAAAAAVERAAATSAGQVAAAQQRAAPAQPQAPAPPPPASPPSLPPPGLLPPRLFDGAAGVAASCAIATCRRPYKDNETFCGGCGNAVVAARAPFCTACGWRFKGNDERFCARCGTPRSLL